MLRPTTARVDQFGCIPGLAGFRYPEALGEMTLDTITPSVLPALRDQLRRAERSRSGRRATYAVDLRAKWRGANRFSCVSRPSAETGQEGHFRSSGFSSGFADESR